MENRSESKSSDLTFNNHCCDNFTTAYSICNNYIPSTIYLKETIQQVTLVPFVAVNNLNDPGIFTNDLSTKIRPPGISHSNGVARQVLCIFRI
jgi:hypothetical protein